MSSCRGLSVTKRTTFDEAILSVQSQIKSRGFELTGYDQAVAPAPYQNLRQDTYHFADSLGNKMDYSVYYSVGVLFKKRESISYSELCGCETSDPNDYERLCGNDGVLKPIKELPKDQNDTGRVILAFSSVYATIWAIEFLILLICK